MEDIGGDRIASGSFNLINVIDRFFRILRYDQYFEISMFQNLNT